MTYLPLIDSRQPSPRTISKFLTKTFSIPFTFNFGRTENKRNLYRVFDDNVVFNKYSHIRSSLNKFSVMQKLVDANVQVPLSSQNIRDFPMTSTVIIKHINHLAEPFKTSRRYISANDNSRYIQVFIPFEREFRVHYSMQLKDAVIGLEKIRRPEHRSEWRMNLDHAVFTNHFRFPSPKEELLNTLYRVGKALELDSFAPDIGWYQGRYYIIEVNTAPGMEERTAKRWAVAIEKICENHQRQTL